MDLLPFNQLHTLEIRGTNSAHPQLKFLMDESLPMLRNVNFESIELQGDEQMKKHIVLNQHPSETYDYVPEGEAVTYNVSVELIPDDEVKIVSYDVYVQQMMKNKQPTFYGWTNLNVLRIHECRLDQVHWEMFDGLTNLHHLSLEHNGIKIVPPFAFYGALNVKTLSLAHNTILDMNYRALAGLLELQTLDLSYNNLSKLSEITFPPFPQLQEIDLRHNPIRYIFPMTFGVMNATRRMQIGSEAQALDLSIGSAFGALELLDTLTLRNVTISTLSESVFLGLQNVRALRVIGGHVKRIEFDAFAEMPVLRELVLSHLGIAEISMDAFYGVRHLEIIDLSDNQLTVIPPGIFDEQRQLKEIYLQRNMLTALPLRFFDSAALKLVRLTENPWVCACEMRTWRQAVTNRVRGTRLPARRECSVHAMTGIETCAEAPWPQYSYVFDNKMTPRCGGGLKEFENRSVYYTLRHSIKCSETTKKQKKPATNVMEPMASHFSSSQSKNSQRRMDKMRIKHKYEIAGEVSATLTVQRPHRFHTKSQVKMDFQNKLRESYQRVSPDAKLKQRESSNTIEL